MPRRREPAPSTDEGVPAELLHLDDPCWASITATKAWLAQQDLQLPKFELTAGPVTRHHWSTRAWAVAAGWTQPTAAGRPWPDYTRLRQAGVPLTGTARERLGQVT